MHIPLSPADLPGPYVWAPFERPQSPVYGRPPMDTLESEPEREVREIARMAAEKEKPNAEEHLNPANRLLLRSP